MASKGMRMAASRRLAAGMAKARSSGISSRWALYSGKISCRGVGALVSATFVNLTTFEKLRTEILLKRNPLVMMLDLGFGILDDAKIRQLMESLTEEQRAKHELRGHLTLGDLTDAQREIVKDLPADGTWSISYSIDGQKITLKSK